VTKRPAFGCLLEIVETLVLTLIIFVVIQNVVAQPCQVKMDSMERTLSRSSTCWWHKLTPRFDTYKRGDIVVFDPPAKYPHPVHQAGDRRTRRHGRDPGRRIVYVNGVALDEPYLYSDEVGGPPQPTTMSLAHTSWTIAVGQFFLMGDNRSDSADSRIFGAVDGNRIIERAWLRYWPADTFGVLARPS
jgi:signal peptidase I